MLSFHYVRSSSSIQLSRRVRTFLIMPLLILRSYAYLHRHNIQDSQPEHYYGTRNFFGAATLDPDRQFTQGFEKIKPIQYYYFLKRKPQRLHPATAHRPTARRTAICLVPHHARPPARPAPLCGARESLCTRTAVADTPRPAGQLSSAPPPPFHRPRRRQAGAGAHRAGGRHGRRSLAR